MAFQASRFPDLAATEVRTEGLDARESALAHAIVDASVRRWLTLEAVLGRFTSQPVRALEPRMRAALMTGAAQLLLLDRVPAHAAVDGAVNWVKSAIRPKAGGMVNAVLRRVADLVAREPDGSAARLETWDGARDAIPLPDGRALRLTQPVLSENEAARWAEATSLPRALFVRWVGTMGPEAARAIALHKIAHPPTVVFVAHARGDLPTGLSAHDEATHRVFTGSHAELRAMLEARRDLWVQDVASSGAVASVADLKPRVVVDLCAGLGTKTRQLRAVFPEAEILATDGEASKLRGLGEACRGMAGVRVGSMAEIRSAALGRADLVLLDVPCSNTGVLARRVEAAYRACPLDGLGDSEMSGIDRLAGIQRQIVADAIPLLSDRASILYATCSLEAEENERVAQWACQWHGLRATRTRRVRPAGGAGQAASSWRDGAFSVLLSRG